MTDWIASMFMKSDVHVLLWEPLLILSITDYLIADNSMEQYGFYASWEEAKKETFPVLCCLVSHCVPFSILLKLYQTLGVRGQEKDSMHRPIFYH